MLGSNKNQIAQLAIALVPGLLGTAVAAADVQEVQITARRHAESAATVAQWVSVVSAEEVERRNPQVIAAALRGEPGAFFQQTGPGQGIVIVRGLKGSEILHLVDGMRLNNAFFRTAPSQYTALLDPNNVGSIELVRGAAASTYGSDALGGVLQVITPEERFDSATWTLRGKSLLAYGSGEDSRVGRLTFAAGREGLSLSAGASYLDYGSRRLAGLGQSSDGRGGVTLGDTAEPTAYIARGFDAKLLWRVAPGHELMLQSQTFAVPKLPRYNEMVPGFGTASAGLADTALSYYDNARRFAHLRYRGADLVPWLQQLEIHAARQSIIDNRFDRSLDLRTDSFEHNRSTLDGVTVGAQSRLGERLALSYGVDWYVDRIDSSRRDVRGGVSTLNGPNVNTQSRFPDAARSESLGAYALLAWKPTDRIAVDFSARWDQIDTHLPVADRLSGGRFTESPWSAGLGVLLEINERWAWASNVRRGLRAPNINDLAQVGRRSSNRIVVANTALKSESLWSFDTGLRWTRGAWLLEADVFYSDYQDRITLIDTGVVYANGQFEASNRNIANARYRGAEAELRYRSSTFDLFATANVTHGTQQLANFQTPANRTPPLNGSLGMHWRLAPKWSAELQAWAAARQDRLDPNDLRDNRINPNGTPGYSTFDAAIFWRPSERMEVRMLGRNLFDRAYREHGSGIDAVGRSITVAIDYRFGDIQHKN